MTKCGGYSMSSIGDSYVRDACRVTRYRKLCIRSLRSFSNSARRSPRRWALAAVFVTMNEAKNVSRLLNTMKEQAFFRRRQRIALSDCIECLRDTTDSLYDSLGELRTLDARTFNLQMGNVETWVSAALSDEDSCLDGFNARRGKHVMVIHNKVVKLTHLTSNALALVSKLASYRGGSLSSP
ncbi:hypothetical protein IFM89_009965 [Coptis chinensis]|uniref:Pectinesterase inhibitor domain-containing protein n=1 Tax=Coptis chinensis TaxID=261450 RepID=A0A835HKA4_9MAGN|nr:hypothetical protein IFM89_009965 [Coptis chinensis]